MKNMIFTAAIAFVAISQNPAQTGWKVDASHSRMGFSVTHMMVSEVEGNFRIFNGEVSSPSENDFTNAKISFTADATSINTEDEKRDAHLKGPDFFDTEKFPQIVFKGTGMKPTGKNQTTYILEGELTMHGVTKKVTLKAVGATKSIKDPWGNIKYGFRVMGTVNRKDFALTWNKALEAGGVAVGDEVNIMCNIELNKAG